MKPTKVEPGLGAGLRGWKTRQEIAKRKMSRGKTPQERERIREIRKLHKMGELPDSEAVEETQAEAPETVEPDTVKPTDEMTRDELVAEIEASGEKAHGRAKDETLRAKVEELRNADSDEA